MNMSISFNPAMGQYAYAASGGMGANSFAQSSIGPQAALMGGAVGTTNNTGVNTGGLIGAIRATNQGAATGGQQGLVNNNLEQIQLASQATQQVQQFMPAGIGELLGFMDVIGKTFPGGNLLSRDPGFSRALDLLSGKQGGIPGYSQLGSMYPTFPQTSRAGGQFFGLNGAA